MDRNELQEEMKISYLKAVKANRMSVPLLMSLHKRSQNIIEKWLYVDRRYPDFQACYELCKFIRALRGSLPIELSRIISRSDTRVTEIIAGMEKNPLSDFEITASRKQKGLSPAFLFVYQGRSVTLRELATELDIAQNVLYARLRVLGLNEEGSDISDIENSRGRGRPRDQGVKKLIYYGREISFRHLSEELDINQASLRSRMKARGMTNDVSGIEKKLPRRGKPGRSFLYFGRNVTIKQVAEEIGVPYRAAYRSISELNLNFEGADISGIRDRLSS